jgi:hypothetical protein
LAVSEPARAASGMNKTATANSATILPISFSFLLWMPG